MLVRCEEKDIVLAPICDDKAAQLWRPMHTLDATRHDTKIVPCAQMPPLTVEDLKSARTLVEHEQVAVRVSGDSTRVLEMARVDL